MVILRHVGIGLTANPTGFQVEPRYIDSSGSSQLAWKSFVVETVGSLLCISTGSVSHGIRPCNHGL